MNVKQFSYILLVLLTCASIFIQCRSTEASPVSDRSDQPPSVSEVAGAFIESVRSGTEKDMHAIMQDIAAVRMMTPEETVNMSDEEISNDL